MSKRQLVRPSLFGRFRASMSAAADAWAAPTTTVPFNAATTGGRLRRWAPLGSGPNSIVGATGDTLVRRSRDMKRNNPIAKCAMDLLTTHIVGSGIRPRSLCKNAGVQAALTQLWDNWSKVSDADNTLDFYGQQMLAVSEMVAGGETFARLRSRRLSDGLPVPLQVQLLPAEMVPLNYTTTNGSNGIQQGIERDGIGARVSYWVYPIHPGDPDPTGFAPSIPAPVPAVDVCHLFNATDRIGQLRGLPWLASCMTTLHQVNDYLDAELVRKQTAAMMVGFLLRGLEDDFTPGQANQMGATTVDGPDSIPDIAIEPGAFNVLNPGQDVKFNEPADVGGSFEPFLRAQYRAVASAAGVLYQELTGDWTSANDRTFRAQFNTFKRRATAWQYNLVCVQFNEPIWNRFIDYAVASGALKVPKSVSDRDLRAVSWATDRWQYINPAQDIEALGSELTLGITSRQAAIAERGDDVEVIDQQIADDRARERKLGLSFSEDIAGANAPAVSTLPPLVEALPPAIKPPDDSSANQPGK